MGRHKILVVIIFFGNHARLATKILDEITNLRKKIVGRPTFEEKMLDNVSMKKRF